MTRIDLTDRLRSALAAFGRVLGRFKTAALIGLVGLLALGWVAASAAWVRDVWRNRAIASLVGNHDVKVSEGDASKLVFARAYFQMKHDQIDAAQAMVSHFDLEGDNRHRAILHYDLGNARLRAAFEKIDALDFDAAGALVGLAQQNYIEAIRLDPDLWSARYNFDVSARLVRQYPSFVNTIDPRREGPHPLWTELPNVPRGEP